ncbi:Uncharacterised protein [Candidatus Anstonella stagnisolia]|nr:Uncharacterised protein [Candidatus Anstonella stagnisolia]
MITNMKISRVEAKRMKDGEIKGLGINIALDEVSVSGGEATIKYTYTADYQEGVGELTIQGELTAKEDHKLLKEIEDRWKKEKKLPDLFAEAVLNNVNYACGANGTLVVRAVNLSPPMIPPRIEVAKK